MDSIRPLKNIQDTFSWLLNQQLNIEHSKIYVKSSQDIDDSDDEDLLSQKT